MNREVGGRGRRLSPNVFPLAAVHPCMPQLYKVHITYLYTILINVRVYTTVQHSYSTEKYEQAVDHVCRINELWSKRHFVEHRMEGERAVADFRLVCRKCHFCIHLNSILGGQRYIRLKRTQVSLCQPSTVVYSLQPSLHFNEPLMHTSACVLNICSV